MWKVIRSDNSILFLVLDLFYNFLELYSILFEKRFSSQISLF